MHHAEIMHCEVHAVNVQQLCVVFGEQGGRSVRTCGRKDGTDIGWAKDHTVAEITRSQKD